MAFQILRVLLLGVLSAAADDASVVWAGGRAELPCAVPGAAAGTGRKPPPALRQLQPRAPSIYSWTHDGQSVPAKRISANGTLEVVKRRDSEGVYQCAWRHDAGLVLGYPVTLKYASMAKQYTAHPENTTARAGQPAALSCSIQSSPEADLRWMKDGAPLPDDPRYHTLPKQLLIIDVKPEDAGFYKCVATNPYLNKTRVSHRAEVRVEQSTEELEPTLLPLQVESSVGVMRGQRLLLPCPVRAWPQPEMVWEMSAGGARAAELDEAGPTLLLRAAEPDQEGVYTCRVAGQPNVLRTFNVSVWEAARIVAPPEWREARRAGTVRLGCEATGRPPPRVSWFRNGTLLPLTGRTKLLKSSVNNRMELVISGVTSEDAGVYQCFAVSDGGGPASAWARVIVRGAAAVAPSRLACHAAGARALRLSWWHPAPKVVLAYTVHVMPESDKMYPLVWESQRGLAMSVPVARALTPHELRVAAYTGGGVASDLSEPVVCRGQGVPITLTKLNDTAVLVSWEKFYEETPDVVQWKLQTRADNVSEPLQPDVVLDAATTNYTLTVSPSWTMQVRVLGTKSPVWPDEDLSLVPWTSVEQAREPQLPDEMYVVPTELEATEVSAHGFTVRWSCEEPACVDGRASYVVCVTRGTQPETCQESDKNSLTVSGLSADTPYSVRVQARLDGARGGAFSEPLSVRTASAESTVGAELSYQLVNGTSALVRWAGTAPTYTVRHIAERLRLPVDVWHTLNVTGNTALIPIDPTEDTFVMVTSYQPSEKSIVLTIPKQVEGDELKEVQISYEWAGARVSWLGAGPHRVQYSQHVEQPIDSWAVLDVPGPEVELSGLDLSQPTFVLLTREGARRSVALTVPPRPAPAPASAWRTGVGAGCGALLLAAALLGALCLWRRTKRRRAPPRSRRRNVSESALDEEEGSEMKCTRAAGAGASAGAGEPLLNGHVRITENPALPKTPNGKTKKPRCDAAFDVSRCSPDTTLETVLGGDSFLLDTSRGGGGVHEPTKLPDDNMNSELTSSHVKDNSKAPPMLQPNG